MTMHDETKQVLEAVDVEALTERLMYNGGLMASKPTKDSDDGLTQYVWRMCRFHSGDDTCMPVTASWWLQEWLDNTGVDASVSGVMDEAGKEITTTLGEEVVNEVLKEMGLSTTGAAEEWKGLVY